MKESLKEYADAMEAHMNALGQEMRVKEFVRSSYHRLMKAKQELWAKEKEILEDLERLHETP